MSRDATTEDIANNPLPNNVPDSSIEEQNKFKLPFSSEELKSLALHQIPSPIFVVPVDFLLLNQCHDQKTHLPCLVGAKWMQMIHRGESAQPIKPAPIEDYLPLLVTPLLAL